MSNNRYQDRREYMPDVAVDPAGKIAELIDGLDDFIYCGDNIASGHFSMRSERKSRQAQRSFTYFSFEGDTPNSQPIETQVSAAHVVDADVRPSERYTVAVRWLLGGLPENTVSDYVTSYSLDLHSQSSLQAFVSQPSITPTTTDKGFEVIGYEERRVTGFDISVLIKELVNLTTLQGAEQRERAFSTDSLS